MISVSIDGVIQEVQPDELLIEALNRIGRVIQAIPEGIAKATAQREEPVSIFGLLRRLSDKDTLRGLAAAIDFLQAFGRHLHSSEGQAPKT